MVLIIFIFLQTEEECYKLRSAVITISQLFFIILMILLHADYAFRFTDYSLSHIHVKEKRLEEELDHSDHSTDKSDGSTKDQVNNGTLWAMFTTKSDLKFKRRKRPNKICCFITWYHIHDAFIFNLSVLIVQYDTLCTKQTL